VPSGGGDYVWNSNELSCEDAMLNLLNEVIEQTNHQLHQQQHKQREKARREKKSSFISKTAKNTNTNIRSQFVDDEIYQSFFSEPVTYHKNTPHYNNAHSINKSGRVS
jgi:hypothetical protein